MNQSLANDDITYCHHELGEEQAAPHRENVLEEPRRREEASNSPGMKTLNGPHTLEAVALDRAGGVGLVESALSAAEGPSSTIRPLANST